MNSYDIKSTFIRKRNTNYNIIIEYINEAGKSKQKTVGKYTNRKDAEKQLIDLKSDINKNKYTIGKDITVADRFQMYIDENKNEWSPCTVRNYEISKRLNLIPFFKGTLLRNLTAYQLQQYINYLNKEYSYSGTKLRYAYINAVLKEAYRFREIQENICDFVKLPSSKNEKTKKSDTYTKEEVISILKCIDGNVTEIPIKLMLLLGLRIGEATGLRWQDVDFENNIININQTALYVNSKLIYKTPKTKQSIRSLYVQQSLIDLLKREKLRQNKLNLQQVLSNNEDLVCLNRYNDPWLPQVLTNNYKKFCKANNIRKLRMHDLRHTNATLLVLSGTDFKTISNRLGHTDIKITINRYSHVLEEMDKKAVENFDNMLGDI